MVLEFLAAETGGTMRNIPASIFFLIAGVLVVSLPLLAHHGNAAFDSTSLTVKGTVTDWTWGNPHCLVMFVVNDHQGNIVHWVAVASNPSDMVARGWSPGSL